MHHAIFSNFEQVQRMLDKGDTFCRADGLNCFMVAVRNQRKDLSQRKALLVQMLEVDSRGVLVKDPDGKTLLNYFHEDVPLMKRLIELRKQI